MISTKTWWQGLGRPRDVVADSIDALEELKSTDLTSSYLTIDYLVRTYSHDPRTTKAAENFLSLLTPNDLSMGFLLLDKAMDTGNTGLQEALQTGLSTLLDATAPDQIFDVVERQAALPHNEHTNRILLHSWNQAALRDPKLAQESAEDMKHDRIAAWKIVDFIIESVDDLKGYDAISRLESGKQKAIEPMRRQAVAYLKAHCA